MPMIDHDKLAQESTPACDHVKVEQITEQMLQVLCLTCGPIEAQGVAMNLLGRVIALGNRSDDDAEKQAKEVERDIVGLVARLRAEYLKMTPTEGGTQ